MPDIPRILHYCWFGGTEMPGETARFIEGWKNRCPDYEIREWNEATFDIRCCPYVQQAYENKKFAFVSDYARGQALFKHGGIYLDTDVELLKSFDPYLKHAAFFGFEYGNYVATSTMGSLPGQKIFRDYLEQYHHRNFILADGKFDLTTNVHTLTTLLEKLGLKRNGEFQNLEDGITCYPLDRFSAFDYANHRDLRTPESVTIHHFSGSWVPIKKKRGIKKLIQALRRFRNPKF